MRKLIFLLVVFSFCAAPAAHAEDVLPVFTKAAIQYWGNGQPPPEGIFYSWHSANELATIHGFGVAGDANPLTGEIRINKEAWQKFRDDYKCTTIFHEIGHLYRHTHDEGGIMSPTIINYTQFPPCARLIATVMVCNRVIDSRDHQPITYCHTALRLNKAWPTLLTNR